MTTTSRSHPRGQVLVRPLDRRLDRHRPVRSAEPPGPRPVGVRRQAGRARRVGHHLPRQRRLRRSTPTSRPQARPGGPAQGRRGRVGPGHRDGHHQHLHPPRVQGRRPDQQRPLGPPLRAAQGAPRGRHRGRARRHDLRHVGRARGQRVRRVQGPARRLRPLQGGPRHGRGLHQGQGVRPADRAWSPSRTSPAATSSSRPSATPWP